MEQVALNNVQLDRFQPMHDHGVMFQEGIPDHQSLIKWFP